MKMSQLISGSSTNSAHAFILRFLEVGRLTGFPPKQVRSNELSKLPFMGTNCCERYRYYPKNLPKT